MSEECRQQIYGEQYFDYLLEYFPLAETADYADLCYQTVSNRFAVLYEKGDRYLPDTESGAKIIPHCYGLLSSAQVLESTGAARVRRQDGLSLYGDGVMVGFVDTGIEYSHPAFIGSDGRTRILSIWDQTRETLAEGEHAPEGFSYGAEYTDADINRALAKDAPFSVVPSRDENGHGTFMAGVACGNRMEDADFSGVAPYAGICMVKCKQAKQNLKDYYFIDTDSPCYAENDIMLGIRYLYLQAAKRKLPLVICLGLGTNQGGHGRGGFLGELLEAQGDYRGVLVTAACGNEANAAHHYEDDGEDAKTEVELQVGEREAGFTMELWAATAQLYSIGLISPTGEYSGRVQARLGQILEIHFLFEDTVVFLEYLLVSYENGDECVRLRFQKPAAGIWRLRIFRETANAGRFDLWLPVSGLIGENTRFLRPNPDTTLCDPSNNAGVITPAYYNSSNRSIAADSGRGYTREGIIKPDFAAPGVEIYGPLPFAGNAPADAEERTERARYGYRSGASAAAAVTAGILALLAQWAFGEGHDVAMDTLRAKNYLIRGANHEGITVPDRLWGNGILDLYGTFDALRTPPA